MARKSSTPGTANRFELDAFDRQVESALEHCADPLWLGERSPLAAPYFLGGKHVLPAARLETARERGDHLRLLLEQCAEGLEHELRALLRMTYFARNPAHDNVALAMALNMSDRTFYRARTLAIKALAQALYAAVVAPLRMEEPAGDLLLGRGAVLAHMAGLLAGGRSIYLAGPSGVGKSALAAAAAAAWRAGDPARRTFWYTLHDHSNDHVASLLFVLGWFLRASGAGNTWRQLVADRTVLDLERILSLVRYDLASFEGRSLLFCVDDVDVLGDEQVEHAQILHVLEVLRDHAPLLLVGQRLILESDETVVLAGLDEAAASALLDAQGAPSLPSGLLAALVQQTRGHPALLRLIGALLRHGDDPAAVLADLGRAPTIEVIFFRIWRRMGSEERVLALQLSVFRTPTPRDAWSAQAATLATLQSRGLLIEDQHGGVALLPHLRPLFYATLSPEQRPMLHAAAADVRATRAEFTRAVEHAVLARQPARAVWLWFANRQREIDRGQGPFALEILRQISLTDLPDVGDRTALQLARSELYQLAGRAEEAREELRTAVERAGRTELAAYTRLLAAQAEEMAGLVEQALESYRAAIDLYVGPAGRHEVMAHLRLSFLRMYRTHEVEAARREAILARAKADAFLGDLETVAGQFDRALELLHAAEAALDEHGEDLATRSRVCTYLSTVHARKGEFDRALAYLDRSIECDRLRGDEVGPLYSRLNRSWVLREMGRGEESEQEAVGALRAAERLRESYLVAGLAAGVAEACWAQGKVAEAEQYATYSLQQEEIFFRAPACVILAGVRAGQGRWADAEAHFAAALDHAQQLDDRSTEAYVWREWALALWQGGRREDARQAIARAEQHLSALGLAHELGVLSRIQLQWAQSESAAGSGVH